jgi:hypothetical protein
MKGLFAVLLGLALPLAPSAFAARGKLRKSSARARLGLVLSGDTPSDCEESAR